jgi:pyruvyltransferase
VSTLARMEGPPPRRSLTAKVAAPLRRSRAARLLWRRANERADLRLLQRSALFDAEEYLRLNPDVLEAGVDPYLHYLRRGARERREPGRFWAEDYVMRYPDVQVSGSNPLIHYLRFGRREGRSMLPPPATATAARVDAAPGRTGTPDAHHMPLRVHQPTAARVGDRLTISCQIDGAPALFAILRGPPEVISGVVPRLEPFLPIALLMAGAARRDIIVHGPIDADYLDTLRLQCVPLLRVAFGFRETRIDVEPSGPPAPEATHRSAREALLFSSGMDSLYSLVRLRQLGHTAPLLVNVNAGAHGDQRSHFQTRLLRIASFAQQFGLDLLSIDTNFHEVVDIGHQYGHPFRTLAAAHTAYGAIGRLFLSTARAFQELSFDFVAWSMEAPGATVSNSVAWSRIPLTEIGYEKTRVEKAATLVEEPLSYHALDVCIDPVRAAAKPVPRPNCGECYKCLQTLFELELTGHLDRYATQFDLEAFWANRDRRIEAMRARINPGVAYLLARLEGVDPPSQAPLQVGVPAWASEGRMSEATSDDGPAPRSRPCRPPVRLFWSTDHSTYNFNIGDELSPAIVRMVSQREVTWAPPEGCDLAAIGSIIEMVLNVPRQTPTVVWGSGFIGDGPPLDHAPLVAAAVRGPHSAARLGLAGEVPLGDPGLLASRLLTRRPAKRQMVGIVPHYEDLDLPIIRVWDEKRGRVISPRLPAMEFLKAVAGCELILSSSLHGLIIADSLGVPNHWVRLSDRVIGHGFKFRDYFRCLGRSEEYMSLPAPEAMIRTSVDDLINAYGAIDVSPIQEDIVGAFPSV